MAIQTFEGLPRALPEFLKALDENNSKAWFDEHRTEYQDNFVEPAKLFVAEMADLLSTLSADLKAEPRIGGSILRINRDIRFSKDKRPYKNWLGIMFWQGEGRNRECPGFFLRVDATGLGVGGGMHGFTPPQLERYRAAVVDPKWGKALDRALRAVRENGPYELGDAELKRIPAGNAADHPRAVLLRHKSLYAWFDEPHPEALFSGGATNYCFGHIGRLRPLQKWLVDIFAGH